MEVKEKWIPWFPLGKESNNYEKISFLDSNKEGIILTCADLRNDKKIMKLIFNGSFVSYRATDETYMSEVQSASAFESSFAYKVHNSKYLQWVSETSKCMTKRIRERTQHFVFISSDDYLEILTDCDPDIEVVNLA